MKNREIVSAFLGSAFFAVPYLGLSVALGPSLLIGCAAFGASELMFSGVKSKLTLKDTDRPLYLKISDAKKQNKEILSLIPKVESNVTRKNLNEIHSTVTKILETIEKEPKKAKRINNFFDYYLPVLLKIVARYDEIENQKLVSKEGKTIYANILRTLCIPLQCQRTTSPLKLYVYARTHLPQLRKTVPRRRSRLRFHP